MPVDVALPPIFLLGSSGYSAELAGAIGAGFSFAHHFASHDAADAMMSYRRKFKASAMRQTPYAILAVHAVCGDTDAEAERLASTVDLNFVRRAKGEYLPLASPEEALAHDWTPIDLERKKQGRARIFVGAPDTVRAKLEPLIAATQADEVMITSMIYDHAARRHCYELVMQAFRK